MKEFQRILKKVVKFTEKLPGNIDHISYNLHDDNTTMEIDGSVQAAVRMSLCLLDREDAHLVIATLFSGDIEKAINHETEGFLKDHNCKLVVYGI